MKIVVDTHFITTGLATGNGTYTVELINALVALNDKDEFILYAIEDHPYYRMFDNNPRVKIKFVLSRNGFVRNYISIPKALAEDIPDVVHLFFIVPFFLKQPVVLTVHDLFYVHMENANLYQRMIGKLTLSGIHRAHKVITISEYSRKDIIATCRIDNAKVLAIPLGINKRFKPVLKSEPALFRNLPTCEYILFIGRTEDSRKNLLTLIDAFSALKLDGKISQKLVIAGRHGAGSDILFRRVDELGLRDDVIFPGIVSDNDLVPLLSGARLFVYVSSFEGFGLPVLEAMACGVPVITSNVTSLPEVAGDAGYMVTPKSVKELSDAIMQILSDNELSSLMIKRGYLQAEKFTWQQTAMQTMAVYEGIYSISTNRDLPH